MKTSALIFSVAAAADLLVDAECDRGQVETAGSRRVCVCVCEVAETMCLTSDLHTPNTPLPSSNTHTHVNPRAVCHRPLTGVTEAGWVGRKEGECIGGVSLGPLQPSYPPLPPSFPFSNSLTVTLHPPSSHTGRLDMSNPEDGYIICLGLPLLSLLLALIG